MCFAFMVICTDVLFVFLCVLCRGCTVQAVLQQMKRVAASLGRQADDFIVGMVDKLDQDKVICECESESACMAMCGLHSCAKRVVGWQNHP